MSLFWNRVAVIGANQAESKTARIKPLRGLAPVWMLFGCAMSLSFGTFACSEDSGPDSKRGSSLRVDSAPPTTELGVLRSRDEKAARNRKALEAFDRWAPLLTSGAVGQARVLCEAWLAELDAGHHGEAHKCLANVEIASSRSQPRRNGDDQDAHKKMARHNDPVAFGPRSAISRAHSDVAVAHYDAAIAAVPFDADAHLGRVDILILSRRYREANLALDESLKVFSSRALLDKWFRLLGRFQQSGDIDEGLAFLKIIESHHPLDHRVVSNLGAYYAMTGNREEALSYSERAVAINPDDPINRWNLARIYDGHDRLEEADRLYLEALAIFGDRDPKAYCDYAEFVGTRLGDAEKACQFAETNCKALFDANCGEDGEGDHTRGTFADPTAG